MATATVSVEEYLNRPEYAYSEYLDGVIRGKYPVTAEGVPMVNDVHGYLVGQICTWFGQRALEWRVRAGTEIHTRVTASRYRLPDISVSRLGPLTKSVQVAPPLIAIEVLSLGNTREDLEQRLIDYRQMGIPNVWVIDPESRRGWVAADSELSEQTCFRVAETPIYLDLGELFAQFDDLNQPTPE